MDDFIYLMKCSVGAYWLKNIIACPLVAFMMRSPATSVFSCPGLAIEEKPLGHKVTHALNHRSSAEINTEDHPTTKQETDI